MTASLANCPLPRWRGWGTLPTSRRSSWLPVRLGGRNSALASSLGRAASPRGRAVSPLGRAASSLGWAASPRGRAGCASSSVDLANDQAVFRVLDSLEEETVTQMLGNTIGYSIRQADCVVNVVKNSCGISTCMNLYCTVCYNVCLSSCI